MTSSRLIRWGGAAAMLAGVAFISSSLLSSQTPSSIGDVLWLVAIASLAVGVVGFHTL